MLDNRYSIATPEGVEIILTPAGPAARTLAFLIDLLIRASAYIVIGIITAFLDDLGAGLFLLSAFFIEWFYPVYFEVYNNGMTPGKKKYNLRVINDDGTPINFANSFIRNLLRFVDFLPVFYGTAYVTMALTQHFQRLGDLAAGTIVVYEHQKQQQADIEAFHNLPSLASLNLETFNIQGLTIEERQSIIRFAQQSQTLSSARQQEIASKLAPVLGVDEPTAVVQLKAIAKELAGL